MVYQWKMGARFSVNAQSAGEEVRRIQESHGGLLVPADVVIASRPKTAPLHPCFEWSNSKAARLYREEQARNLIRSIVEIRPADGGQEPIRVVAYVHVKPEGSPGAYMGSADVMADATLREQAIKEALTLLNGIRRRYEHLTELGEVFAAIERAAAASKKAGGARLPGTPDNARSR